MLNTSSHSQWVFLFQRPLPIQPLCLANLQPEIQYNSQHLVVSVFFFFLSFTSPLFKTHKL